MGERWFAGLSWRHVRFDEPSPLAAMFFGIWFGIVVLGLVVCLPLAGHG